MDFKETLRNRMRTFLVLAVLLFGGTSLALAQGAGTGEIRGTVTDPGGLVVPDAAVTVRNVDTGAEIRLTTTQAGVYAAPFLTSGRYEVIVRKEGFAEVQRQNLRLEVGQTVSVDIQLPLRTEQEVVQVTDEVPLVETEKFDVSQVITQEAILNIPLNGRRWDNLVLLTPGVSEDGGFGGISFRGINSLYNNNQVDGADNNQAFFSEARGRTRIAYGYSMNAIKEFNVSTAVYSAEHGRAAGGVVNAITRSGSNTWHGDGFYFIRDDFWLARDPRANALGQGKPPERRQQFGGGLGGPLVPDKLFFFLNYDQQKRNFPAVIGPFGVTFFQSNLANSQTNPNNCNHPRCPEVIAALTQIGNTIAPRRGDQYLGLAKVDYQVDPNHRLSGVFNILRWNSPNGILTGPVLTSTALANGTDIVENEFITLTWNQVWTQTLVNETRFQYGRDFEAQTPNASGPSFIIADAPSFGMPNFLPRGAFPNEKRFQWMNTTSWLTGRHQVKFGFDINHVRDFIQNLFQGGGVYSYFNGGVCGGLGLNNFVSDLFDGTRCYTSFAQSVDPITINGVGAFTTTDYNFFVQDNIKLRPNLTVNLGLRYELQDMPSIVQRNPLVPETGQLNTDQNNLAPRVGFAWGLGQAQRAVLRGGYGIYYGRTQNSSIFIALFQNGIFQRLFSFGATTPGGPVAPNTVFPLPNAAPPFGPIFGPAGGPTPRSEHSSLEAFLAANPGIGGTASVVNALDPDFRNPIVHQFDLAIERELFLGLSGSISYVGSRGQRLPVFVDANLPPPDTAKDYVVLDASNRVTQIVRVPFFSTAAARPNPNVGVILMGKSVVNSWYHGMIVRLRSRPSGIFFFDTNFTWSQARDNGQVLGVSGTFAGTNSPLNPFNMQGEYGVSDIDIRRRFVMHGTLRMPWAGNLENAALKGLFSDWRLSGTIRVQDGRPVTANMASRPFGSAGGSPRNGGLTGGVISSFGSPINGRAAHLQRNSLFTTPALINFDARLSREIRLTEAASMELIWEAFNVFNKTHVFIVDSGAFNFIAPSGSSSSPCFRDRVSTGPDFNGCIQPRSTFLNPVSTGNTLYGARQMQIGARFRF